MKSYCINKIHGLLTKNKLIVICIILISLVGTIYGLLSKNNQTNYTKDDDIIDNKGAINPTTNININPAKPNRRLDDNLMAEIEKELKESKPTVAKIIYVNMNTDAEQFAAEIANYLKQKNLEVRGPFPGTFYGGPNDGQLMFINKEGELEFQIRN